MISSQIEGIEYGLVCLSDVPQITEIYFENFSHKIEELFPRIEAGKTFYLDMITLMLFTFKKSFFVARHKGKTIGYLILIQPDKRPIQVLFTSGFLFTVLKHFFMFQYEITFNLIKRLFIKFLVPKKSKYDKFPQIDVIAVNTQYKRLGIGSTLLHKAKLFCLPDFPLMSLNVDIDNLAAINLYNRTGFQIVSSNKKQHQMVWNF